MVEAIKADGNGRTKNTYPMDDGTLRRFMAKVLVEEDGCWVWTAGKTEDGYGQFFYGKNLRAHRVSYAHFVGQLDQQLVIDHLCRNTSCVNPAHLEQVTWGENIRRGENQAAIHARKDRCIRGHLFTPENIQPRGRCRECKTCRDIAMRQLRANFRDKCGLCHRLNPIGELQRHARRNHPLEVEAAVAGRERVRVSTR